jgi:hypothetical protein
MTPQTLEFHPWGVRKNYVFCLWEDVEMKIFKNAEVAEKWAEARGFKAVFVGDGKA